MTKSETRELNKCKQLLLAYVEFEDDSLIDMAARSLSALIRATMSDKTKRDLLEQARELQLNNHPDFIV